MRHPKHGLGDRLRPTAVAIADEHLAPLRAALDELGITLDAK
jgi:hypothetical protein